MPCRHCLLLAMSASSRSLSIQLGVQVQGLAYAQSALGPTVLPHKLGLFQAFSEVIRQEGLRALWKGNGVTIVHRLPYSAVNFWSYERCSDLWTRRFPPSKDNPSQDVVRRLVCGGSAGMLACTVVRRLFWCLKNAAGAPVGWMLH